MQPPRIVERAAFRIMGIEARTRNTDEINPASAKIPGLWEKFGAESLPGHIPHQPNPGVIYGLYCDFESDADGAYTLMAGCEVDAGAQPPGTLNVRDVPAARYAVFTSERGPMPDVIIDAWSKIWEMAPVQLGGERAYTGDFELYDERAAGTRNVQIEIWISIKP